jgi:hypothetical protein
MRFFTNKHMQYWVQTATLNTDSASKQAAQMERPPEAELASVPKAASRPLAQQDSSGSSTADPSPMSTATVAAAVMDSSARAADRCKGKATAKALSAERCETRLLRSSSCTKTMQMRTRSSASLDGLAHCKTAMAEGPDNAGLRRGDSSAGLAAGMLPRVLSPSPDQLGGTTQYSLQVSSLLKLRASGAMHLSEC